MNFPKGASWGAFDLYDGTEDLFETHYVHHGLDGLERSVTVSDDGQWITSAVLNGYQAKRQPGCP